MRMKAQLSTIIAVSLVLLFIIPMIILMRQSPTPSWDERLAESEEFRSLRTDGKNFAAMAEKYYEEGDAEKAIELYEKAIETYRKALKIRPENAEIHNDLGAVYYNLGEVVAEPIWAEDLRKSSLQEAMGVLRRALEEVESGMIVLTLKDRSIAESLKSHALVQGCYAHICPVKGDEFDLYVIKGRTKELFLKAESEFLQAKTLNPKYAPAYRNLGALYIRMGRKEEGIENLKLALRIEPYDKELRTYLQQFR